MTKYGMIAKRTMDSERLGIKSIGTRRLSISGRGTRERAAVCERCGRIGDIELHHRDYRYPDLVKWLCRPCHVVIQKRDRDIGFDCSISDL